MSSGYRPHTSGMLTCGSTFPRRCNRLATFSRPSDGRVIGLCQKHIVEYGFICKNCGRVDTEHLEAAGKKCLFLAASFAAAAPPVKKRRA